MKCTPFFDPYRVSLTIRTDSPARYLLRFLGKNRGQRRYFSSYLSRTLKNPGVDVFSLYIVSAKFARE